MSLFRMLFGRMRVPELRFKREESIQKPSLLKEAIDNPESFKLEAFIDGEEIIVKIKRRES